MSEFDRGHGPLIYGFYSKFYSINSGRVKYSKMQTVTLCKADILVSNKSLKVFNWWCTANLWWNNNSQLNSISFKWQICHLFWTI